MTDRHLIENTFKSYDKNEDNLLTRNEAIKAAAEFSLDRYDTKSILKSMDLDDIDKIPVQLFSEEVKSYCVCKFKKDPFREIFRRFDQDDSGLLDFHEIQMAMSAFGISADLQRVKRFFDKVDRNQDGLIDEEEYISFLAEIRTKEMLKAFSN